MLRLEGVGFAYPGGSFVLRDVDLELSRGEISALVGPNGCGKTTLLKLMIGLLEPVEGSVSLDGTPLRALGEREVFSRVGMVFQDPNDQIFLATPEQDVQYGLTNLGLQPEEVRVRAREAMEAVGIGHKSGVPVQHLSHGEKKRVALAGMLAMRPEFLLLDEPTNGLDPMGAHRFMRTLVELKGSGGMGIMVATHDLDMVPVFCDRMYLLDCGRVVSRGEPSRVFQEVEKIRRADLRLPRVAHLMEVLWHKDGLGSPLLPLTIGQARRAILGWGCRS
ncbi:ATP-binding cassette domain-containing protein [Candidatus Solincola tengchongensis]|uniref:energy-coupling factor ABC transporter ATP-binding protein n=1 Tax=Candidatus Solincola tengchongensis TaxID=2900693 RepID=UPI0025810250|nr:ATP-binding cassette domain-containing protein [Candidatus Solincola tengchongensis]